MKARTILGNLVNQASQHVIPNNLKQGVMKNWLASNKEKNTFKRSATSESLRTEKELKRHKNDNCLKTPDADVEDIEFIDIGATNIQSPKAALLVEEIHFIDIEDYDNETNAVLPVGVTDIDTIHGDEQHLWSEYAPEIYAYLRQLETTNQIKEDYLRGCIITGQMRSRLIDWMVSVHLQFKLLPETLFMSVNILDRFLEQEGKNTSRDRLQLVGVVAMLIASKIEEIYIPTIDEFVYSTDNAYNEEEVKDMELKIMRTLDFNLTSPISLTFLRRFSVAGNVDVVEHSMAKYILELSLMDYGLVGVHPSLSAAAALHVSLLLLSPSVPVWSPGLEYYSGYSRECLMPVVRRMISLLESAEDNRLQSVRNKYSSRKFRRVALLKEAKKEFLTKRMQSA